MNQHAGHFPSAFNYVVGKMHRYFVTACFLCACHLYRHTGTKADRESMTGEQVGLREHCT